MELYCKSLEWEDELVDGKIYNAGYENHPVMEIASIIRDVVGNRVKIEVTSTDDHRSYHISSEKIKRELGFVPQHTIKNAVQDLVNAFDAGQIPDPMAGSQYSNIKTMQGLNLK